MPYPDKAWNSPSGDDDAGAFVSVQSIVVDPALAPARRPPSTKAEPLATFRPIVEGRPFLKRPLDGPPEPMTMGADSLAISADGERIWYAPLMSRRWYSVSAQALAERSVSDEEVAQTVVDEGDKGSGADGLETDDAGRFYVTAYEHNSVLRRMPDGSFETFVHDARLLWPDTMSVAADGHLYVTANQLHRQADYQGGQDRREKPYALLRVPIDAGPVRVRR